MGIPVLILGPSGSGKSASLRNFEPEEVGIFNVANKFILQEEIRPCRIFWCSAAVVTISEYCHIQIIVVIEINK